MTQSIRSIQSTQAQSFDAPHHPVPAFQSLLAIGAMLATLAVVAYACLHTADGAERVHLVMTGAKAILVTWGAGFIASGLHLAATVRTSILPQRAFQ